MKSQKKNISRALIALVLFFNLQCAVLFLIQPDAFLAGFEVSGVAGRMLVQALGLLFLMWNVPYVVACLDPIRQRTSLVESTVMQALGLAGETILLLGLAPGHVALRDTALRFILFDACGLVALLVAFGLTRRIQPA